MAYNEILAERIRIALLKKQSAFSEKKMMGGLCFMVNDKMCVGVIKDNMMVRIDPVIYEEALNKKGCREMDFTRRPMKGFAFIEPEGIVFDKELEYWVKLCLDFNPKAKSSVKKKII